MITTKKELKRIVVQATHCEAQHTGWPCGTCFFSISKKLTNEDWQALLLTRGDYDRSDLDNLPKDIDNSLNKIIRFSEKLI